MGEEEKGGGLYHTASRSALSWRSAMRSERIAEARRVSWWNWKKKREEGVIAVAIG